MSRAIIKFKQGETQNAKADSITKSDEFIEIRNGENIVAIIRPEMIDACYLVNKEEVVNKEEIK
jgi:hypothetical protein